MNIFPFQGPSEAGSVLELLRDHVKLLLGNARELVDRCCEVIKGRGVDHTVVEGEFYRVQTSFVKIDSHLSSFLNWS